MQFATITSFWAGWEVRMNRISALDGLRGIAIALVVAFHLFAFPQGWIGVDIFFVLSGYLITTILLNERNETHFWKMFYIRRMTRILPPFLLLLLIAGATEKIPLSLWPYLIFSGQDIAAATRYALITSCSLTVLWSLAIEEHFYFIWPSLVRIISARKLTVILITIFMAEPFARLIAASFGAGWKVTYFLTPFRLDGIALGSLLALAIKQERTRAQIAGLLPYALPAASVLVAFSFPWLLNDTHFLFCDSIGYSLIAITAALVVASVALDPQSLLARALSIRPLTWLGRISYGMYVYHTFLPHFLMRLASGHGYVHSRRILAISLVPSLLLSWLSFAFYETPFLEWGKRKVGFYREELAIASANKT
jgi:peptidoglycan/LPS O-acetylase OafA/YrhL